MIICVTFKRNEEAMSICTASRIITSVNKVQRPAEFLGLDARHRGRSLSLLHKQAA